MELVAVLHRQVLLYLCTFMQYIHLPKSSVRVTRPVVVVILWLTFYCLIAFPLEKSPVPRTFKVILSPDSNTIPPRYVTSRPNRMWHSAMEFSDNSPTVQDVHKVWEKT